MDQFTMKHDFDFEGHNYWGIRQCPYIYSNEEIII